MKKIVYVCDIDDDIDDMIAVEYMHREGVLDCVVLDRPTESNRVDELKKMGIKFEDKIPEGTIHIFCGGALTRVAEYVKDNTIELLVCNGGFAGTNVVAPEDELDKFRGRKYARTYNFGCDIEASQEVLESDNVKDILLVSKNVCHHPRNTAGNVHTNDMSKHIHYGEFLQKYNLTSGKRLHDLLMVKEGLAYIFQDLRMMCEYKNVSCMYTKRKPYPNSNKFYDMWGCVLNPDSNIKISVKLK